MSSRESIFVGMPRYIGDFVMGLPALDVLRKAVPGVRLLVGVTGNLSELVAEQVAADETFRLHPKTFVPMLMRLPWDVLRWRLKAGRPLIGFSIGYSKTRLLWMRCLGARCIIAESEQSRLIKVDHRVVNNWEHLIQRNIRKARMAARLLGGDAGDPDGATDIPIPRLKLKGDWIGIAKAILAAAGVRGKYILVLPLSTKARKDWAAENYRALIRRIHEQLSMPVVIAGTRAQAAACRNLVAGLPGAFNIAGKTSTGSFAGLISGASLVLGGDSGGGHVAGALGILSLSLFFEPDFTRARPIGPRAEILYLHKAQDRKFGSIATGMDREEVEIVFAKLKTMIADADRVVAKSS